MRFLVGFLLCFFCFGGALPSLFAASASASTVLPTPDVPTLTPFLRVEFAAPAASAPAVASPGISPSSVDRDLLLTTPVPLTVLAIRSECSCISALTVLPLRVDPGQARLSLRIAGLLPGVKTVRVDTTAGTLLAQVQVVLVSSPGVAVHGAASSGSSSALSFGSPPSVASPGSASAGTAPVGGSSPASAPAGSGLGLVVHALHQAFSLRADLIFLVHDLRGELRNCGCSGGSLGGIDHLAALPALTRRLRLDRFPTVGPPRFLLSGNTDDHRSGVAAALADFDWTSDPATIRVTDDLIAALSEAARADQRGPIVLIPASLAASASLPPQPRLQHRSIVEPVLTGGMVVEALLIRDRQIQERMTIPVDASLLKEPAILARFPSEPVLPVQPADPSRAAAITSPVVPASASASSSAASAFPVSPFSASASPTSPSSLSPSPVFFPFRPQSPSSDCASCHAAAVATWATSRHARALDSLPAADRTASCLPCHTTPATAFAVPAALMPASPPASAPATTATAIAPPLTAPHSAAAPISDLHCHTCHTGAAVHATAQRSGLSQPTTGTTDCRTCHDVRHDPAFDQVKAWLRIQHGK